MSLTLFAAFFVHVLVSFRVLRFPRLTRTVIGRMRDPTVWVRDEDRRVLGGSQLGGVPFCMPPLAQGLTILAHWREEGIGCDVRAVESSGVY